MGLTTVLHVSVGKVIELQFKEAITPALEKKLQTVCHDLLSNPVIEDYLIVPATAPATSTKAVAPAVVVPEQSDYEGLDAEPEGEAEELLALESKPKKAAKKVAKEEKKKDKSKKREEARKSPIKRAKRSKISPS